MSTTTRASTGRRRVRRLGPLLVGAALAAGVLSTLGILAPAQTAHATHESISVGYSMSFEGLRPGITATEEVTVTVPRNGILRGAGWIERSGVLAQADLDIELCTPAGSCIPASDAIDREFEAGELRVRVSAEITGDIEPGSTGTAIGALTFAGTHDDAIAGTLPATGGAISPWIAAIGGGAIMAGLLLALRRRRQEDES